MYITFEGTYSKNGDKEKEFSFSVEFTNQEGEEIFTNIESDGGYSYYKLVTNHVIDHLSDIGILPGKFTSNSRENLAYKLAKGGLISLNFYIYAEGYEPIKFPCLDS